MPGSQVHISEVYASFLKNFENNPRLSTDRKDKYKKIISSMPESHKLVFEKDLRAVLPRIMNGEFDLTEEHSIAGSTFWHMVVAFDRENIINEIRSPFVQRSPEGGIISPPEIPKFNEQDAAGMTPLHIAAYKGNFKFIEKLVGGKILTEEDILIKDKEGRTAKDIAEIKLGIGSEVYKYLDNIEAKIYLERILVDKSIRDSSYARQSEINYPHQSIESEEDRRAFAAVAGKKYSLEELKTIKDPEQKKLYALALEEQSRRHVTSIRFQHQDFQQSYGELSPSRQQEEADDQTQQISPIMSCLASCVACLCPAKQEKSGGWTKLEEDRSEAVNREPVTAIGK